MVSSQFLLLINTFILVYLQKSGIQKNQNISFVDMTNNVTRILQNTNDIDESIELKLRKHFSMIRHKKQSSNYINFENIFEIQKHKKKNQRNDIVQSLKNNIKNIIITPKQSQKIEELLNNRDLNTIFTRRNSSSTKKKLDFLVNILLIFDPIEFEKIQRVFYWIKSTIYVWKTEILRIYNYNYQQLQNAREYVENTWSIVKRTIDSSYKYHSLKMTQHSTEALRVSGKISINFLVHVFRHVYEMQEEYKTLIKALSCFAIHAGMIGYNNTFYALKQLIYILINYENKFMFFIYATIVILFNIIITHLLYKSIIFTTRFLRRLYNILFTSMKITRVSFDTFILIIINLLKFVQLNIEYILSLFHNDTNSVFKKAIMSTIIKKISCALFLKQTRKRHSSFSRNNRSSLLQNSRNNTSPVLTTPEEHVLFLQNCNSESIQGAITRLEIIQQNVSVKHLSF